MKKRALNFIALATAFFAMSASFLVNANLKRHYKPGDYVPEEGAYFGGEIDNPVGLVKAHKFLTPSDPKYSTQKSWSMSNVGNIESVWSDYTGAGTTIAIIDDGFDVDHPEYVRSDGTSAILSTSRYYYSNTAGTSYYYKQYSQYPNCLDEDWEQQYDGSYEWATHGTNTSTTAAAPINGVGGVGIAPDANILAIKIDMSFIAIREAISYAISQNVDVINMSLGAYADFNFEDGFGDVQNPAEYDGKTYTASDYSGTATYLNSVCQQAYNAGIIVVAAAGNEATTHKSYPACNTKVVGVGALYKNSNTTLAPFTNYVATNQTGEINVDILAPGYVYTAHQEGTQNCPTHTYNDTQGTSFSSPIVAGAACLWKQKNPSGTPDQFLTQLQSTADNIGYYADKNIPISKYQGYSKDIGPSNITQGQLNVFKLLGMADPYIELTTSTFNISVSQKKQIEFENYNGTLTYQSLNANVATVSNSGLVTGVSSGSTTVRVTASANSKTAIANLTVNVASAVASTSLSFSPSSISLNVGETYESEPTITLTPSNASRVFMFASNDETVATVDYYSGTITGVGPGTTTIDATTEYGSGFNSLEVTVEGSAAPTSWDKVTSDSDLTDGDYLIVYENGSVAFNGGLSTLDTGSNTISVSITNNQIPYDSESAAAKFTISSVSGGYSIQAANGKYISGTSGTNVLNSSDSVSANSIEISGGDADIVSNTSHLRYNSASDQARFRYFKSSSYSSQKAIQLYKAASSTPPAPTPTVTGVTVSPSSLNLDLYGTKTATLTATVTGTNSPSQTVTWSSSDSNKVSVSASGVVTALAVTSSNVTITATSIVDGTKSGTCSVSVVDTTPKTLSSISISGQTTSLEVGSSFSFGGTVTAHYSNSTTADVTASATFSGYDMAVAGVYTVIVSYTEGTTKTTEYTLTVYASGGGGGGQTISDSVTYAVSTKSSASVSSGNAPEGSSIGFSNNGSNANDQLTKDKKEVWTLNGYEDYTLTSLTARLRRNSSSGSGNVRLTNNGKTVTVSKSSYSSSDLTASYESYEILAADLFVEGTVVLTLTSTANSFWCDSITVTYEKVESAAKVLLSLSASYSGGDVYVGDSLDASKVSVTANYTDSSTYPSSVLPASDYSLSEFSSLTAGTKTIIVTYTGSLATLTPTVTTTFSVTVITDNLTGVVASNSRTYHPGETIIKSHITVTLSYQSGRNVNTSDFSFADDGYQFTYLDAPSGGTTGTKQFSITYNEQAYNFIVNVNRNSYQSVSGSSTTLSSSAFNSSNLSKNSGTASSTSVTIGGVGFTVTTNAYVYSTNSTYYLSFGKGIGSIQNTSAFATDLTAVSVTQKSGARQDGVLSISKDGTNWTSYSASEIEKGGYKYFKYEYTTAKSGSNASAYSNLQTISFSTAGADTPTNVANYIMYEDTNNQCVTKLDLAIDKLNTMSSDNKTTFWTSNDYVIATARERIQAWARHEGKTLNLSNNNFVMTQNTGLIFLMNNSESNQELLVICVFALVSLASIGGLLIIKKRKSI